MKASAFISDCGLYRFTLSRPLEIDDDFDRGDVLFLMNNPSKADAEIDDPTIKRVMAFAASWSFGMLWVMNTNPHRATNPSHAHVPSEAILEINDRWLRKMARRADLVVAAWGGKANPKLIERTLAIVRPYAPIYAFALTKTGQPKHPLYLKADTMPKIWRPRMLRL